MNQSLTTTMFPAAKQFLLFWLQRTINTVAHQHTLIHLLPLSDDRVLTTQKDDLYTSNSETKCSQIREQLVTKGNLSLTKVKENTGVLYVSAIGLKLSQDWGTSAIDIATQIEEYFSFLSNQELSAHPKKYFTLKAVPPGWLHLQLTDLGIATWLQSLAEGQGGRGDGKDNLTTSFTAPSAQSLIFSVQYAHARCCSLLRLAEREGKWGAIGPDAIPWLNEKGELRLTHPAERNLISQLFSALDALHYPEPSKNLSWEKLAHQISLSWEKFYSQCRIWGEVKTETPELAQARLGLLIATQAMLRLLLEDYLGVPAPLEL
ncbi:MAG: DALR anticodon-binding domain-containing protein [Phormidium sp.]